MSAADLTQEEFAVLLKIPAVRAWASRTLFGASLDAIFSVPAMLDSRVEPSAPNAAARFEAVTIAGDKLILDHETGLMWDSEDALPGDATHAAAMSAAAAVRKGGFDDWRAPTQRELYSLVDLARHEPAADPILNLRPGAYWSSTPAAWSPEGSAWDVGFHHGDAYGWYRGNHARVRAVRVASQ